MVVVILVAYPIAYFILNWSDRTFRDGAVGNWFGTVVGVVVGVPVGMALARAQQKAQSESERLHELAIRRERQRSIAHRVYEELEYNLTLVKYLTQVLSKSPTTRGDLWDWAEKVVGGMEFEAWREFDATLLPEQRSTYASSELAYRDVKRLVSRVRESTAAHGFLFVDFQRTVRRRTPDLVMQKIMPT